MWGWVNDDRFYIFSWTILLTNHPSHETSAEMFLNWRYFQSSQFQSLVAHAWVMTCLSWSWLCQHCCILCGVSGLEVNHKPMSPSASSSSIRCICVIFCFAALDVWCQETDTSHQPMFVLPSPSLPRFFGTATRGAYSKPAGAIPARWPFPPHLFQRRHVVLELQVPSTNEQSVPLKGTSSVGPPPTRDESARETWPKSSPLWQTWKASLVCNLRNWTLREKRRASSRTRLATDLSNPPCKFPLMRKRRNEEERVKEERGALSVRTAPLGARVERDCSKWLRFTEPLQENISGSSQPSHLTSSGLLLKALSN